MLPRPIGFVLVLSLIIPGALAAIYLPVQAGTRGLELAQQPAATLPQGAAVVTVNIGDNPEINVRAGPGTEYASLGKLQAGQSVPALGRSPGGDWVQVAFPGGPGGVGWVYAYLVTVTGNLTVVEPPPTPTPRVTPTIDPTLAAQFIRELPPTRLPTFTAPPTLAIPTFVEETLPPNPGGKPVVFVMIGLALLGILGTLLSFIRIR